MTNREKLIDLLTEKDGLVNVIALDEFLYYSPLAIARRGCGIECKHNKVCFECVTDWLNEEAKE